MLPAAIVEAPRDAYAESMAACTAPSGFVKTGRLAGHDAVALILCNGGSRAGSSMRIFVNFGPQAGGTVDLGEIVGGDHMNAYFADGYVYVTSALHGEMLDASGIATGDDSACDQCYTRMLAQRIGTRREFMASGPLLVDGGVAIVELSPKRDYRDQLTRATFSPTAVFQGRTFRSSRLVRPPAPAMKP